jgi:post-segregation antitoxin (ccd killing protein)
VSLQRNRKGLDLARASPRDLSALTATGIQRPKGQLRIHAWFRMSIGEALIQSESEQKGSMRWQNTAKGQGVGEKVVGGEGQIEGREGGSMTMSMLSCEPFGEL